MLNDHSQLLSFFTGLSKEKKNLTWGNLFANIIEFIEIYTCGPPHKTTTEIVGLLSKHPDITKTPITFSATNEVMN